MTKPPPLGLQLMKDFADYALQADAISKSQAIATFDLDGVILSANQNYLDIFGYTWAEIDGQHHSMFVEPTERDSATYRQFWSTLGAGNFQAAEYRRIGKDGRQVWLQASYNPVLSVDGRPFKIVKLATDMTEQKRIQAALAAEIDAIGKSQAMIEFGLDGTILSANRNFLTALGYELEELQGQHHRVLVDPAEWDSPAYRQLWESLSRGEYQGAEYKRIGKDGREVWFQATYNPIFGQDGKAHKIIKLATNITAQKVKAGAHADRDIAISPSQLVIEFDMDGNVLAANETYLETFGYDLAEIIGRHHSLFVDPADRESAERGDFTGALRNGEHRTAIIRRIGKGARQVWLQASYNPILDARGVPYKVVKLAIDITARRLAETRVAALQAEFLALLDSPADAKLRLFEGVVVQSKGGVMITDVGPPDRREPRIIYTNPAFTAMTGYAATDVMGKSPHILEGPLTAPEVLDQIHKGLEDWQPVLTDVVHHRKDGTAFWAELSMSPISDEAGRYTHWIFMQRNITERKRLTEAHAAQHELLEVTLKSIGDAVVCTDVKGKVTFSNVVAEKLLGAPAGELEGLPLAEIMRMIDACRHGTGIAAADGIENTLILPEDYTIMRTDGCRIAVEGSVAPICSSNWGEAGKVIVFRDVSNARAIAQETKRAAYHDTLTGLPNRLLLFDRIEQAIASAPRNRKSVAVLFVDLNGFKRINDSLGHAIGDKLLISVGSRLTACVRASDTVSRQGGDEFVVLLTEMSEPADAGVTARRFLQALEEANVVEGHSLRVTASIGISVYPDDGLDAATLIKAADTAMYKVKASGTHSFQFFEPAMEAGAVERQYIEESLRRAIEKREFVLHYQPKINIRSGAITGAEALIRWTHPERGSMAPTSFIPVAENCGLICTLGSWALREACEQGRRWREAGLPPITLAVNVSPIELCKSDFLDAVLGILNDTGFDPQYLELEVTEGVLMKRAVSTDATLKALKETGLRLAIDDFGTGYSSLSYLTKFPIDTIKIDQSFVRQISTDPTETAIVTAVISMAHSLNLCVVAEGVETREEFDFLSNLGCDEAQGYYFSRPVPAASFAPLLFNAAPSQRVPANTYSGKGYDY
jgi:diguanylate cyclase (GGDEF)-like protein/PAS domain S-box-containing protein